MDYKKELFCTLYVDNMYDSFIEIGNPFSGV